jgi:hypothetical protein
MNLLDDRELDHLNTIHKCTVCKDGELVAGPMGGSSQNFRCDNCGQEYNLGFNPISPSPVIWIGERLPGDDSRGLYNGPNLSEHPRLKKH